MRNCFEELMDQLVLVVYKDQNLEKTQKGILKGQDENFVFLETLTRTVVISKNDVKQIRTVGGGDNHDY